MLKRTILITVLMSAGPLWAISVKADDDTGVYVDLHLGGVLQSDKDYDLVQIDGARTSETANVETGLMAGFSVGYNFNKNLSVEAAWDWRRNTLSEFALSDGTQITGGDYAANAVTLNAYYHLDEWGASGLRPFIGAGAGFIEEIDFDAETNSVAAQFESSGEFVWQVMAGISYPLSDNIALDTEVQYLSMSGTDLTGTENGLSLENISYNPMTVSLGVKYKF